MSLFTKRRKVVRQKQEADRKRWSEECKKQNKSIENMLKATKIIDEQYPEYESLEPDERVKLFAKVFNELK